MRVKVVTKNLEIVGTLEYFYDKEECNILATDFIKIKKDNGEIRYIGKYQIDCISLLSNPMEGNLNEIIPNRNRTNMQIH
jgi:hypothetical protein